MNRDIAKLVTDSFAENDKEDAKQYLEWLKDALADLAGNVRRTSAFVVFLVVAFEFIYASSGESITVGGFRFYKGSIVLIFVPPFVSYLLLQLTVYSENYTEIVELFIEVFKRWSDRAGTNDLDIFVIPASPLFWNLGDRSFKPQNQQRSDSMQNNVGSASVVICFCGIVAFEVQAYVVLANWKSVDSVILWIISLCVTVLFLSMTVAHEREIHKEDT